MSFIKHKFGSYRGYVTHLQTRAAAVMGRYAACTEIDWLRVERFVFVCKGNVCRSPYAEARARSLNVAAISFGLETSGGTAANATAQRIALLRCIDLSGHRSMQFDPKQIRSTDLLVAFEPAHLEYMLQTSVPNAQSTLVGLWSGLARRPYIADPFGKSEEYFQACFDLIDSGVGTLVHTSGLSMRTIIE